MENGTSYGSVVVVRSTNDTHSRVEKNNTVPWDLWKGAQDGTMGKPRFL